MKKLLYLTVAILSSTGYNSNAQTNQATDFSDIQNVFVHAPDTIQTSIYWYWISGNISKEGVVKDLEAMKKVGINRAFIGNIGLDDVPSGKVKMFSDEWWDILHATLKKATELNMQIGIFNGPGWSQSGGPWIKPNESMRYLTSSETTVKGPITFNKKLDKPQDDFQDVKLIAYPVPADYNASINTLKPALSSEPKIDSINNIIDDNLNTAIHLKAHQALTINIDSKINYTARSVVINTTSNAVNLEGDIEAKMNNGYVVLKHFIIDRSNPALNTGFIPFGPAAISIPATTSNSFKIKFSSVSSDAGITELKLSSTPIVENYIEKTLAKMWPTPHPFWEAYQWPQQPSATSKYIIDPAKIIDISKYMQADGMLKWKVPAGTWMIERTGMVSTSVTNSPAPAEGRGLEVDKMSSEHVAAHFNAFLGEILKRIPAEDRKSFKVVVEDSYETGGQNWTDSLLSEFKRNYHYDPMPYMPVLQGKVIGNEDKSDRFLWDLRRLIADDVSYKYVSGLADISHKNGLTTWLENYGHWGYPGEFLQYGGQSDEIGGEFWSEGDLGDIENRAASSSAHIYGKTKVSAESFTAAGSPFARYPAVFKMRGDRFFTEGINNTLMHVYISQPQDSVKPGVTAWFGVEFNRLNTWFYDMDVLLQYLKRCNYMLQQGRYVADAAYFIGEDAPKMTDITNPPLPQGYSFDYINGDVIKQRLVVKDGKLELPNGISYSILVLPQLETMRPELLMKIQELVKQGAVVLGPKPSRSPSLENYPSADKQVQNLANEMWGKVDGKTIKINHYGKGLVLSGMTMQEAFDTIKTIADLKINLDSVLFIHRAVNNDDVYFISNQRNAAVKFTGTFRTTGKAPELWNAIDGSIRDLTSYVQTNSTTLIPLQLAPLESSFIVFRKNASASDTTHSNYLSTVNSFSINKPWTVTFDSAMRGPVKPVIFDSLIDWSQSLNNTIKYYSGTAFYHTTFNIDSLNNNNNYIIDLGLVKAIAKVSVNGVDVGGVWTPPYQINISSAIKQGINQLDIKVVNTWVNRLIGDAKLPPEQRKTSVQYGPGVNDALQSSGLLGPVVIKEMKYN